MLTLVVAIAADLAIDGVIDLRRDVELAVGVGFLVVVVTVIRRGKHEEWLY